MPSQLHTSGTCVFRGENPQRNTGLVGENRMCIDGGQKKVSLVNIVKKHPTSQALLFHFPFGTVEPTQYPPGLLHCPDILQESAHIT